ncbi:ATP-binding cassette domain-containing protein [Clostridium thermarum]|uniref:ATP-binding cassette domain-containing protein n=1 Tax=Clostridium thermarum TaxID=1716543 RepID=UPI0013D8D620|nr:ATP-binding cassette domain-containing protein [Clostridium thermarum]
MREEILRIENITKFIDDTVLLKNFNLNMFKGEILGLLSQNTNCKDYLTDLLSGKDKFYSGRIYFNDKIVQEHDYRALNERGIFSIESTTKLCTDLTVSDNIFVLRKGFKKYFINKKVLDEQIENIFSVFNIKINPNCIVTKLSKLERCIVELIKAYVTGAKIIILNDLTSYLSTVEIDKFNEIVLAIREKGISFLYIDSYLDVLFEISDRIVIMRGGRNVKSFKNGDLDKDTAISILMGENYSPSYRKDKIAAGKDILNFCNVCTEHIEEIDFTLFKREVVSIVDVTGKGTKAILNILKGTNQNYTGEMKLGGESYTPQNQWEAIAKGVGVISENPIEHMLYKDMTVLENLCFLLANKIPWFWLRKNIRKAVIKEYLPKLGEGIFAKHIDMVDRELLQRLVYYRWQLLSPKLIICIKPFTGLDIAFRKLTMSLIDELAIRGTSILILTSNITEAYYTAGNRILVLNDGKMLGQYKKNDISLEEFNEILYK